jgi:HSP20 family molecular chaperone IbpA
MSNTALEKRQNSSYENKSDIVNVPDRSAQSAAQYTTTYYTPLVDIAETNEAFVFQADLPGVRSEDLDIRFDNGTLTIDGKVQRRGPAERGYLWREYGIGHFNRSFSLSTPIDVDGIKAELRNGELTLTVPKAASARRRKIEIKSS